MIAEPVLEKANVQPPAPEPIAENQVKPTRELPPQAEISSSNSAGMVYVPGFGWIESRCPNQVEYAEDMYENGNQIGIMG